MIDGMNQSVAHQGQWVIIRVITCSCMDLTVSELYLHMLVSSIFKQEKIPYNES